MEAPSVKARETVHLDKPASCATSLAVIFRLVSSDIAKNPKSCWLESYVRIVVISAGCKQGNSEQSSPVIQKGLNVAKSPMTLNGNFMTSRIHLPCTGQIHAS